MVTSYEEALRSLSQLHEMGIHISIDDFGAGNTSIDCFTKTSIDSIKIDQMFTKDIIQNPTNRMIVQGLINLSTSVGLETIAEGVETLDILKLLLPLGVDYVQGYYFYKPMDYLHTQQWLKSYSDIKVRGTT